MAEEEKRKKLQGLADKGDITQESNCQKMIAGSETWRKSHMKKPIDKLIRESTEC